MKVICHINEPTDLLAARYVLEWALSEPGLKDAGAVHADGKQTYFEKKPSGTVVIHVQKRMSKEVA
jgi:hypothetical protein